MKTKTKKIIKIATGTVLTLGGILTTTFLGVPPVQEAIPILKEGLDPAACYWVGFSIGITMIIWYPISRLFAWLKTRKLKNQNLEMDIELKKKLVDNPQDPKAQAIHETLQTTK